LSYPEFAKAGTVAEESIVLNPGSLDFNPSKMEHLRKLGLAVEIVNGSLELKSSFVVAKAGAPLTPEQAKMLVHLNNPIINFKIEVLSFWSNGKIEEFEN
jgi:mRNA turnover protein 4